MARSPCRLLRIDLGAPGAADVERARGSDSRPRRRRAPARRCLPTDCEKNLKRLGKLAQRAQVSCYRLYDADMPEYAFAIDRYAPAAGRRLQPVRCTCTCRSMRRRPSIEQEAARRRRREVLASLPGVLRSRARAHSSAPAPPPERCATVPAPADARQTPIQRGNAMLTVEEGGLRFLVNLDDYLDTGLFLDHRLTRARLRERARVCAF